MQTEKNTGRRKRNHNMQRKQKKQPAAEKHTCKRKLASHAYAKNTTLDEKKKHMHKEKKIKTQHTD